MLYLILDIKVVVLVKSFRDQMGFFSIYDPNAAHDYLDSLGPLIKPQRIRQLRQLIEGGDLPENKL